MEFAQLAHHLAVIASRAEARFLDLAEMRWRTRYPGSGGWTRVELLGHLIDSAANNRERILRALIQAEVVFPGYPQQEMVATQRYADLRAMQLIPVWTGLNELISGLLAHVPKAKLGTRCIIGTNAPMTLETMALDYVAHLEHHLKQLPGADALPYSDLAWPPPERWGAEISAVAKP